MKAIEMTGLNVALETVEQSEVSKGGIYIPKTAEVSNGDLRIGKVVSVGVGEYHFGQFVKPEIAVDDFVVFDRKYARLIDLDGRKLQLVGCKDILGKVIENAGTDVNP
jgi:co-chaperonin GroES (HSP10)